MYLTTAKLKHAIYLKQKLEGLAWSLETRVMQTGMHKRNKLYVCHMIICRRDIFQYFPIIVQCFHIKTKPLCHPTIYLKQGLELQRPVDQKLVLDSKKSSTSKIKQEKFL